MFFKLPLQFSFIRIDITHRWLPGGNKMPVQKKDRLFFFLAQLMILTFLTVFFIKLCPLTIFDADDWALIRGERLPIPIWHGWNPTRVLPETLYPFCGRVAAVLFYPLTGDFVQAVRISCAIVVSLFITALCMAMYRFLQHRFSIPTEVSLLLEICFLAGCFLIFRTRPTSSYLFRADNLTCVIYYTCSGVLNGIVILLMAADADLNKCWKGAALWKKILFGILVYFAVFSNLFHSGMLAVFCFVSLFSDLKSRPSFQTWLKQHLMYLVILGGFLIACIFEYFGGRANVVDDGGMDFLGCARQLWTMVRALSKPYIAVLLFLLAAVIVFRRRDAKARNLLLIFLAYEILITCYLFLLCSKVLYMSRVEASFGIWLGLVVLEIICLALLAEHIQKSNLQRNLVLLVTALSIVFTILPDGRYQRSLTTALGPEASEEMDETLISAITEADREGQDSVTVDLNGLAQRSDLLLTEGIGQIVSDTLYYYGITENHISVTVR